MSDTSIPPVGPTPAPEGGATAAPTDLVLGYCGEAAEALDNADQALLCIERGATQQDSLTVLGETFFRIRGGANVLGFHGLAPLAVAAYDLVQAYQQGLRRLAGPGIDALFDAVSGVRTYIDELYNHLDGGVGLPDGAAFLPVIARLAGLRAGENVPEAELPHAEPGVRLGAILEGPPLNVSPAAIQIALESQLKSGRRLGEELVASHLVEGSIVARALRAQAQAGKSREAGGTHRTQTTAKVDQDRLDALMEIIGEMVVVDSTMRNVPEFRNAASDAARRCLSQLAKVTRDLSDAGTRLRMQEASDVFQVVLRNVRELSRRGTHAVKVVTEGDKTELDRTIVDQVTEPLLTLVRISIQHGIEPREAREKAGKAIRGTIRLSAHLEGGKVVLEVADDGAGIDRQLVAERAASRGVALPASASASLESLVFAPGVWPPPECSDGIGNLPSLDTIKRQIEALRGRLHVRSTPGSGTTFRLVLPLTLTTLDAMLVACGAERFLIPTLAVLESIRPAPHMVVTQGGRAEMLSMRGSVLPMVRLSSVLDIEGARVDPTDALVMVLEAGERRIGLLVDDVVAQQHVVIKELGTGIGRSELFSGAGIHGDGQVGLILDMTALVGIAAGASC